MTEQEKENENKVLLDFFAAAALLLNAIEAAGNTKAEGHVRYLSELTKAERAYALADAMLSVRNRKQSE